MEMLTNTQGSEMNGLTARQRIVQALQQQRGIMPQGTGPLAALNQALQGGMQMYAMKQRGGRYQPKLPKIDPVMGTGYSAPDPLWNAVDSGS